MNKKNVLMQVAGIYIAMIGVGNAAPPFLDPVTVETVEGKPLEVNVTNKSEIRIPSTGVAECDIDPGSSSCNVDVLAPESFPSGTNTFVIQQISVHQSSFTSKYFDFFFTTTHQESTFRFRLPIALGIPFNGYFDRDHTERVLIYHDAILGGGVPTTPVRVKFRSSDGTSPNTATQPIKQTMNYSGYYTFFDQPQP